MLSALRSCVIKLCNHVVHKFRSLEYNFCAKNVIWIEKSRQFLGPSKSSENRFCEVKAAYASCTYDELLSKCEIGWDVKNRRSKTFTTYVEPNLRWKFCRCKFMLSSENHRSGTAPAMLLPQVRWLANFCKTSSFATMACSAHLARFFGLIDVFWIS